MNKFRFPSVVSGKHISDYSLPSYMYMYTDCAYIYIYICIYIYIGESYNLNVLS